jgi:hypothetical protein
VEGVAVRTAFAVTNRFFWRFLKAIRVDTYSGFLKAR